MDGQMLHHSSKRVKLESGDEESSSTNVNKASSAEEYYCRNPAGGSSLLVVKPSGGNSSGTDNEADHNDASSTENYEPLDFKSWRSQRPSNGDEDDEDEDQDEEDYPRASLTVELGPASSGRLKVDPAGGTGAPDFITQTVRTAK